jgi:hypothetical protein
VSIRLVEGGVTDAICLPLVDVPIHMRLFTTRATKPGVVVVEGDDQDRINPAASPV